MKTQIACLTLIVAGLLFLTSCTDKEEEQTVTDIWDIDIQGIPQFIRSDYIELDKIQRISRFRSSVGHDYSDAFEQCRSMKHYFEPKADVDWTQVKVYSPVAGTLTRVEQEWAGTKLEIASDSLPAFRFSIFHMSPASPFSLGQKVTEGQYLGTHIGNSTYSDISVIVNDPTRQGRMVSWFDVMTDALFSRYAARGVNSRTLLIISKGERDAHPLECSGDAFISNDTLEGWVLLQ
ncbi:MAG: hypothetical protein IPH45_17645 [Bacteroidales bacterium]|nr:hypothetical protein [Bacteroidales bacterium]